MRLWCPEDTATLRAIEYLRLEQLLVELWPLVDAQPPRYRAIDLYLKISDRQALLTGNYTVAVDTDRGNARQELELEDPRAHDAGDWTDLLEQRARGKTFEQLAAQFGLADRAAASRRVDHDLREFLRGASGVYVAKILRTLDKIHADNWPAATANPPVFTAVEQVLRCHDRRAKLLGLDPEPDPTANPAPTDDTTHKTQPVLVVTVSSCAYSTCETGKCHLPKRPLLEIGECRSAPSERRCACLQDSG